MRDSEWIRRQLGFVLSAHTETSLSNRSILTLERLPEGGHEPA